MYLSNDLIKFINGLIDRGYKLDMLDYTHMYKEGEFFQIRFLLESGKISRDIYMSIDEDHMWETYGGPVRVSIEGLDHNTDKDIIIYRTFTNGHIDLTPMELKIMLDMVDSWEYPEGL